MNRNDQLSPAHQAYLAKSGGSGWILLGLIVLALAYGLVTGGGLIGQAIVASLLVGTIGQIVRKLADRR